MKTHLFYLTVFLVLISTSLTFAVESAAVPSSPEKKEIDLKSNSPIPSKKDWEKKLGRKLNFKERLSLRLIQKKLKKQAAKQTSQQGKESIDRFAVIGFLSGMLSLFLTPIIGIVGIDSFVTLVVTIGILGIVGIVCSAIGMHKTQGLKGFRKKGRGYAIAGLIIGILLTLFSIFLFLLFLTFD